MKREYDAMIKLLRIVRMAILALRRNVMRSALTTLGIIIGVWAVIVMVEIGQGSSKMIQQTIASMGANNLRVQPGAGASGGVSFGSGTAMTLTPEDGKAILEECSAVESMALIIRIRTQVVNGNRNWVPSFIYGTTPSYLDVRDWDLDEGEPITELDVRNSNPVCLLGKTLVTELFEGQSPIDHEVRVQNVTLKVKGVLARKGSNTMGMDQDDVLIAPWTTIKYRVSSVSGADAPNQAASPPQNIGRVSDEVNTLRKPYPVTNPQERLYPQPSVSQLANTPQPVRFTNVDQILVKAHSGAEVPIAVRQISDLLRKRHRLQPGQPDDFNVRNMAEMSNAQAETAEQMSGLLLIVALVSLVVGGVGIMNIMLVAVTERTREIGLRMAVGARSRDILRQFLVEAVVLCLLGGTVGVLFGRGTSVLVRLIKHWPTEISLPAIIAAVAVSAFVGIAFGFYPAWKAARLDPIEALRYE
jgi:ABC-type antimicrobial peptide transport system permease subunit